MLTNIQNKILYKIDEFKCSHKLFVTLTSLKLEHNRVKVYYKFKCKVTKVQKFDLSDLSLQNLEFNQQDQILLYRIQGVYIYLQTYGKIAEMNHFLESINDELQA